MIDIHMHVIPGVDDGSRTMEESLDLLRCAQSQGITSVIATSHSAAFDHGRSNRVFAQLKRLQHAAEKEGLAVDLYPGAEILCFRHNVDDAIAKLQRGTYPTLMRRMLVTASTGSCRPVTTPSLRMPSDVTL